MAADVSYVGWAPMPPPNYVPPPGYYPPGGYYPGASPLDLLTAPFWIFARAAQFLLGFGQPYVPSYSYGGCGCLAPVTYYPVLFPRTVFLTNYVINPFYPRAFFAFGPPIPYVARVTNIRQVTINNYIKTVNVTRMVNVAPPATVINRNVAIRQITPTALVQGQPLPRVKPATNVNLTQIARPNVAALPKDVPRLTQQIPKAAPLPATPPERGRGMGLPSGAAHQVTPKMQQEIQKAPLPAAKMAPAPREMKPGAPPVGPKVGPPAAKPGPPPVVPPKAPPAMKPGAPSGVPPAGPPAAKPGPRPEVPPATKPSPPPERLKGRPVPKPAPPAEFQKPQPRPLPQPRPQPQPQVRPQAPVKAPPPQGPAPQQKQKPQQQKQLQQPQ
jgi:hypothetical protein